MTTRQQHEQQARDNLGLHDDLVETNRYLDWAVTALFYAALHYIDAFLFPEDPRDHGRRNQRIRARADLRPIWPRYRLLQEKSRDARYECFDPTLEELAHYRRAHFDPLQSHMLKLLQSRTSP